MVISVTGATILILLSYGIIFTMGYLAGKRDGRVQEENKRNRRQSNGWSS